LVTGQTVDGIVAEGLTPDEEVAEVFAGGEGLRTEVAVDKGDGFAVGDSEAVVGIRDYGLWEFIGRAAAAVVDGLVVIVVRCLSHTGKFFAAAVAGVGTASLEEALKGIAVEGYAFGLREHWRLPFDTQPHEVFDHGFDVFGFRTLRVEVFVAKQEYAAVVAGALEGSPEGGGVAEMEKACGAWG
jgi:hypothetical protein